MFFEHFTKDVKLKLDAIEGAYRFFEALASCEGSTNDLVLIKGDRRVLLLAHMEIVIEALEMVIDHKHGGRWERLLGAMTLHEFTNISPEIYEEVVLEDFRNVCAQVPGSIDNDKDVELFGSYYHRICATLKFYCKYVVLWKIGKIQRQALGVYDIHCEGSNS